MAALPAASLRNLGLAGRPGSVRLSVGQPLFLKRLPPLERETGFPASACAPETENWILCLIHLYCNDVYNLVVFHYLIFKKPILLVFYMKKILQKLNLCCIFPEMLCVSDY